MNEITIRIRYKKNSKPIKINLSIDKDSASCEEIAMLASIKLTQDYAKYMGGKKSMKELKRYEFGQYKLILHCLEKL